MEVFERNYKREDSSWSWPYLFSIINNNGLSISPSVNLISNIGYGANSVHTKNPKDRLANLPTFHMQFPLIRPERKSPDVIADFETNKIFYKITIFNYGLKYLFKKLGVFSLAKYIYRVIIRNFK